MAIFKLSREVIENIRRAERRKVIVDWRDITQQIATLKSRLIALNRERSEIVEKLASLERLERDVTVEEAVVPTPERDTRLVTMACHQRTADPGKAAAKRHSRLTLDPGRYIGSDAE